MNRFFNLHAEKECKANSKVGFQSFDTEVAALQSALSYYSKLADQGLLVNGDIVPMWGRFSESNTAEAFAPKELILADGTVRQIPETVTKAEEDDEIPF